MNFEVGKIYVWDDAIPNGIRSKERFKYVGNDPDDGLPLFEELTGTIYVKIYKKEYDYKPLIGFGKSHEKLVEFRETVL